MQDFEDFPIVNFASTCHIGYGPLKPENQDAFIVDNFFGGNDTMVSYPTKYHAPIIEGRLRCTAYDPPTTLFLKIFDSSSLPTNH